MKKYSSISLIETLISLAIVGVSIIALMPVMTIKKTSTDPYKGNTFFTQKGNAGGFAVTNNNPLSIGTEKAPKDVAPARDERPFIVVASGLRHKNIPPLYVNTRLKFLGQEVNVNGDVLNLTNDISVIKDSTNPAYDANLLDKYPSVRIGADYTAINNNEQLANTTILANNGKEYMYVDGNNNVYIGENVRANGPVSMESNCGPANNQVCSTDNIVIANFPEQLTKIALKNRISIGRKPDNRFVIDYPNEEMYTVINAVLNTKNVELKKLFVESDKRLKNIIGAYKKGLSEIERLKPVEFTYKNDDKQFHHIGVIAQDLKKIFPESIAKDPDTGYLLLNTDEIFYALLNSIKELDAQNKAIEKDNDELEAKIAELKKIRDNLKAKKGGSHE